MESKFTVPFTKIIKERNLIRLNRIEYLVEYGEWITNENEVIGTKCVIYNKLMDVFYIVNSDINTEEFSMSEQEDLFQEYRQDTNQQL